MKLTLSKRRNGRGTSWQLAHPPSALGSETSLVRRLRQPGRRSPLQCSQRQEQITTLFKQQWRALAARTSCAACGGGRRRRGAVHSLPSRAWKTAQLGRGPLLLQDKLWNALAHWPVEPPIRSRRTASRRWVSTAVTSGCPAPHSLRSAVRPQRAATHQRFSSKSQRGFSLGCASARSLPWPFQLERRCGRRVSHRCVGSSAQP